jgi:hypothetical protein
MVSSPCSDNAQLCDKSRSYVILRLISETTTLARASDTATMCQAFVKFGGVSDQALAATPTCTTLVALVGACAAWGSALTAIGTVASSAYNSCTHYLASLDCPNAKVACPLPPLLHHGVEDVRALQTKMSNYTGIRLHRIVAKIQNLTTHTSASTRLPSAHISRELSRVYTQRNHRAWGPWVRS